MLQFLLLSLQLKNQLNSSLTSKLQKVKDHLKSQQKVLEERKKEIEKLRGWDHVDNGESQQSTPHEHSHLNAASVQSHSCGDRPHSAAPKSHSHSTSPMQPPSKRSTPSSSSKKRRARKFEAKHRQLLVEEGQAFRQHQTKTSPGRKKGDVPSLLSVPPPDSKWYEDPDPSTSSQWPVTPSRDTNPSTRQKRHVRFTAEAIVLNAALEGELDLLKECMEKVRVIGTP